MKSEHITGVTPEHPPHTHSTGSRLLTAACSLPWIHPYCAGYTYVNLTQARVIRVWEASVNTLPP